MCKICYHLNTYINKVKLFSKVRFFLIYFSKFKLPYFKKLEYFNYNFMLIAKKRSLLLQFNVYVLQGTTNKFVLWILSQLVSILTGNSHIDWVWV